MPDKTVYCQTREEAIAARAQLRKEGCTACFGKAKSWEGYNVTGNKIRESLSKKESEQP